jgi:hypothetical protein
MLNSLQQVLASLRQTSFQQMHPLWLTMQLASQPLLQQRSPTLRSPRTQHRLTKPLNPSQIVLGKDVPTMMNIKKRRLASRVM